jgi:hypothetical protein
MTDSDKLAFAETVFEREQRREKEISSALKRAKLRRATAQARASLVKPSTAYQSFI